MIDAKENIKTDIRWHVVSVNSKMEIETAARINNGGFVAHCPTYVERVQRRRWSRSFTRTIILPLFTSYIFIRPDDAFRKEIFEDSKVRLYFLPNGFVTDAQMTDINAMANKLTLEQSRTGEPIVFKRGETVQVLTAAMAGKQLKVLQVLRKGGKLLVEFVDRPGSYPVEIDATSVAKVI